MPLRPRPEIEKLKVPPHGGINYAELRALGISPDELLDFSVNANPFPAPAGVREALSAIAVERYPDSEATEVRDCLACKLEVAPGNILVGNGALELIRLLTLAYLGTGDPVLVLEPTFSEYKVASQIAGAEVIDQGGVAEEGFLPLIHGTIDLLRKHHPRLIFICNPNNPAGWYLTRREIERVLDNCGDGLLILDEAYISFTDGRWSSVDLIARGNVVIIRSMTKDYALAGLRLGYALAHGNIIDVLRRVMPPWNVNIAAQKAGIAALEDADYYARCWQEVQRAKRFLMAELDRTGFPPVPSKANFFLVKVGNAGKFRSALLKHGILVRDCTSFGLPRYVRIAPRTLPECQKLMTTMKEMLAAGEL